MNMNIVQLRLKQRAFNMASALTQAMKAYEITNSEDNLKQVTVLAQFANGMPLPSGRWGNAIALALETGNYLSAEQLIEQSNNLNLETSRVVSELGGNNPWPLEDEFLFSLLIFDEQEQKKHLFELNKENMPDSQSEKDRISKTLSAIERIKQKLNVKEEVIDTIRRVKKNKNRR